MGPGHRDIAAGGVRIDDSVDPSERYVAAGRLGPHLAVQIGDGDVATRGGQVDVVLRRNVDEEMDVEVGVPVEPRGGMVVAGPDVNVVAFLRKVDVEILEELVRIRTARCSRAANDVDADVGGSGSDFDVAEIGIE